MNIRQFIKNSQMVLLFLLPLIMILHALNSKSLVAAPLPNCIKSTCKMVYSWKNWSDTYAIGMQSQDKTPKKVLYGMNGARFYVKNDPDPNTPNFTQNLVDRYEYQNYSLTCDILGGGAGDVQEVTVTDSGSRVALDINYVECVNP